MNAHAEDRSGEGFEPGGPDGGGGPGGPGGLGSVPGSVPEARVDGPETVAEERLLASLRERARAVNLTRVLRLVDLLEAFEAGRLDEAGRHEAEGLAHQVVGSAGTFGSPGASRDAVAVEEFFADQERPRGRRRHGQPAAASVRATLERLRAEFGG